MRQTEQIKSKQLRSGYTTGTCAAGAAKAGAIMLLTGEILSQITVRTPSGTEFTLPLTEVYLDKERAYCAIRKDSGDDPDVSNGMLIYATVTKAIHGEITVEGGIGIGRVTKPGLACKVGGAAINPVPMQMILSEVREVRDNHSSSQGLDIVISAPEGEKISRRTFNPRLGIVGGISILGTTGIVEPRSKQALIDTIYVEMKQQRALGKKQLLMCPGNYGQVFIRDSLKINIQQAVMCSNFIGEALDFVAELEFESLLLVGHVGKLIKLGAGIMNTHSKSADARMEIIGVHAAMNGASPEIVTRIMHSNTTEEAVTILKQTQICEKVFNSVMKKVDFYVQNRVRKQMKTGVVLFSNDFGILGKTADADELIGLHQTNKESR